MLALERGAGLSRGSFCQRGHGAKREESACYKPPPTAARRTARRWGAPQTEAHEKRLLHDHVGAVLQLAGRPSAARWRHRVAENDARTGLAGAGAGADVRAVLRAARAAGR